MCDCLKENEALLLKKLQDDLKDGGEIVDKSLEAQNTVYTLPDWKEIPVLNYKYKRRRPRKDGTLGAPTNEKISLHFTFCPFCGNRYEEEK